MDLRYLMAPFLKFVLPSFLANPRLSHPQVPLYSPYILPVLKIVFSLLIAILTILFLFFSIKLSLNTTLASTTVCLRGRNFSVLVALSLLCSLFLSHAYFWMVYLLILCLSPWESLIFKVMKWVFSWLYHTLEAIPDLTILCITQQEADHHMQVEVEVEVEVEAEVEVEVEVEAEAEIDGLEGHTDQEQVNLEGACVVLIADDDEVL